MAAQAETVALRTETLATMEDRKSERDALKLKWDLLAAECRAWRAEEKSYPGEDEFITLNEERHNARAATDAAGALAAPTLEDKP